MKSTKEEQQKLLRERQKRHRQKQKTEGAVRIHLWITKEHDGYFQELLQSSGLGRKALLEQILERAVADLHAAQENQDPQTDTETAEDA